ncbi:MAG: hypothetical protein K0S20_33 [Patescibacteria group bacterium]|jgi:vancomycin resistance protein YoaR|nr:hypothetical protein [Patescibacteria group bacterium]
MKKQIPEVEKQKKGTAPKPATKPLRKAARMRVAFITLSALILVGLTGFTAYAFYVSEKIVPHTEISGVSVGGLTKHEARDRLDAKVSSFKNLEVPFQYEAKTWTLKPSDLETAISYDQALEEAYAKGKQGPFFSQIKDLFRSFFMSNRLSVDLTAYTEAGKKKLDEKILSEIENPVAETSLSFIPGKVEVKNGKAGQRLDANKFEADLYAVLTNRSSDVRLSLATFQPTITAQEAVLAQELATQMLASSWKIDAGTVSLDLDPQELATYLSTVPNEDATGLTIVINQDKAKTKVSELAKKANTDPANARLKSENGVLKISQPEKNGVEVVEEVTVSRLLTSIAAASSTASRSIQAETKVSQADLRTDNYEQIGIKELIGTATTDFSGSPANRIHNIKHGQSVLNGGFVKDGEVYSTTGTLGPVEISTGYLPELIIRDNRTTPEAGGGLCQVSTTLFRAVLNAGLPVTDRTNHSYRVGYYERGVGPGLDATVYIPNPDFKWKNDTGNAVYIQSYVVGTKITFELYGTRDGRSSVIGAPQILEEIKVGEPIYAETDTLYKGERKQVETAHDGARTSVVYTVTRNGEQLNRQVFNSYYRPWPAQYLVGTKERP